MPNGTHVGWPLITTSPHPWIPFLMALGPLLSAEAQGMWLGWGNKALAGWWAPVFLSAAAARPSQLTGKSRCPKPSVRRQQIISSHLAGALYPYNRMNSSQAGEDKTASTRWWNLKKSTSIQNPTYSQLASASTSLPEHLPQSQRLQSPPWPSSRRFRSAVNGEEGRTAPSAKELIPLK